MAELRGKIGSFTPQKTGIGFWGNNVLRVHVYQKGIALERKKGVEQYVYADIDKITAKNYASLAPAHIIIKIHTNRAPSPIEFALHPNRKDVNLLLGVFCDYLLGSNFPANLRTLDLELGGLGTPVFLRNGSIVSGSSRLPAEDLTEFITNTNGYYELRFQSTRQKLAISPDYAPNILASIKVLSVILAQNHQS